MLDGVLEGLALALDARFHFAAQLAVHLEVLDLQLAVPFFRSVDELSRYAEMERVWRLMIGCR